MPIPWIAACILAAAPAPTDDAGPFVRALWCLQAHGKAEAVAPANDLRLKSVLFKALGKDGVITLDELGGLMSDDVFQSLAGGDRRLSPGEIAGALKSAEPESRRHLHPSIRRHLDALTTSYDMIGEAHREAGGDLAAWIARSYRPGQALDITVVCTGNSRRSILGSTMGNVAAAYYGLPEIRFHSGGTAPTAFNPRTIEALRSIGVEIEPTGDEAPRGEPHTANPRHRVRWGTPSAESPMEAIEFSKHYADPANPQKGFAALMVCSEADAGCPIVKGASKRISMPYLDPKLYDGSPFEAAKYAERRDDIARLLLSSMMQARLLISAGATAPEGSD